MNPKAKFPEIEIYLKGLSSVLSTVSGSTLGIDEISNQMLQGCPNEFKSRILSFYNTIFQTRAISQFFKTALIVPIKKPNKNNDNVESFRLISLLPCLYKLLETSKEL